MSLVVNRESPFTGHKGDQFQPKMILQEDTKQYCSQSSFVIPEGYELIPTKEVIEDCHKSKVLKGI